MSNLPESWEVRLAALWASLSEQAPTRFLGNMQELVKELPEGDAIGLFELACSQDSTGRSHLAVPLYRSALAKGLFGLRRRRATIQLASSLRNVGKAGEAVALLEAESLQPEDELSTAVSAFRALALSDVGREREGMGHALSALSKYLPRYNASLSRYAAEILRSKPEKPAA